MRDKSRACYCASALCMVCGMLIIGAGLVVLYLIAADKSELGRKMSSTVVPGQPIPSPLPSDGREREGKINNTDTNDLWYLLVMIIGGGLLITLLGFLCSNCAILCCAKRRNSISDSESNQNTRETFFSIKSAHPAFFDIILPHKFHLMMVSPIVFIFLLTFSSLKCEIRWDETGISNSETGSGDAASTETDFSSNKIISSDGGSSETEFDDYRIVSSDGGSSEEEFDDEKFSVGNKSTKMGEVTFPIVLDVSVKQNESRVIRVNCRPIVRTTDQYPVHDYIPRSFLERSVCDLSIKETMVIVAFLFILLTLLLSGLVLCYASGKDETIPVAIATSKASPSIKSCPAPWNHDQSNQQFQPLAAQHGQIYEPRTTARRDTGSFSSGRF